MRNYLLVILALVFALTSCESVSLLLQGDKPARFKKMGNSLYLRGVLGKTAYKRLRRTLNSRVKYDTLLFVQSDGSESDDYNLKTARLVRQYQLITKNVLGNLERLRVVPTLYRPKCKVMTKQWQPLTDSQWAVISPFFNLKRKRKHDLRQIVNAILWLLRTGSQWRNLTGPWPHWQAVYYYFDRWKSDGTFEKINLALNKMDRHRVGKDAYPSLLCIDSQSVKLGPMICEYRGLDVYKRVNGRKRQLVVDTQGRLWVARVHGAGDGDGSAAISLIEDILWTTGERLEKVLGDQAYNGVFARALSEWSIDFEKASRPESARGFVPVAKRWVVERSIAWTNFFRRVTKDYEHTVSSSVAWLYLANSQLMLQRIEAYNQT